MSQQVPTLRETLNNGVLQQVVDVGRQVKLGEILGFLLQAAAFTQTGVVPASNVVTLANAASTLIDITSTAGTFTGRLTILVGDSTVVPVSGQAVWAGPGTTTIRLAAVDVITAVSVKYCRSDLNNTTVGMLERILGQRP